MKPFLENNGKLVWQGDKKDICYQGTTTKKITCRNEGYYELDGRKSAQMIWKEEWTLKDSL